MLKNKTLEDYQIFLAAAEGVEDERELNKIMYQTLVAPERDVEKTSYRKVQKDCQTFLQAVNDAKEELILAFKLHNTEFGFIPDLEGMTFGELTDIDAYYNRPELHHKLMAILYRPITDVETKSWWQRLTKAKFQPGRYRITEYNDTSKFGELMKDMPLTAYFSALGFFDLTGKDLRNAFPSYLPKEEIAKT